MSVRYWVLRNKLAIPEPDLYAWAAWLETGDRFLWRTNIGTIVISTVFLGIDHSFGGDLPILFETMVFRNRGGDEMERYSSYDEAEKGHARWVATITAEMGKPKPVSKAS